MKKGVLAIVILALFSSVCMADEGNEGKAETTGFKLEYSKDIIGIGPHRHLTFYDEYGYCYGDKLYSANYTFDRLFSHPKLPVLVGIEAEVSYMPVYPNLVSDGSHTLYYFPVYVSPIVAWTKDIKEKHYFTISASAGLNYGGLHWWDEKPSMDITFCTPTFNLQECVALEYEYKYSETMGVGLSGRIYNYSVVKEIQPVPFIKHWSVGISFVKHL